MTIVINYEGQEFNSPRLHFLQMKGYVMENQLSFSSVKSDTNLKISSSVFGTSYKSRSVDVVLIYPEDILLIPQLFAKFLSEHGIQTRLEFKDSKNG